MFGKMWCVCILLPLMLLPGSTNAYESEMCRLVQDYLNAAINMAQDKTATDSDWDKFDFDFRSKVRPLTIGTLQQRMDVQRVENQAQIFRTVLRAYYGLGDNEATRIHYKRRIEDDAVRMKQICPNLDLQFR